MESPQRAGANDDLGVACFWLATQNLEEDYALPKRAEVEFLSTPTEGVDGMADIAICCDPDGTLIVLIEIHPENWGAG